MSSPTKCPGCGEYVSPFAAGCALCGAKLDPRRGQSVTMSQQVRAAWASRPRLRKSIPAREKRSD